VPGSQTMRESNWLIISIDPASPTSLNLKIVCWIIFPVSFVGSFP
jgi:hypothetical protein